MAEQQPVSTQARILTCLSIGLFFGFFFVLFSLVALTFIGVALDEAFSDVALEQEP